MKTLNRTPLTAPNRMCKWNVQSRRAAGTLRRLISVGVVVLVTCGAVSAETITVRVGVPSGFDPSVIRINPGDTVRWVWQSTPNSHDVTSGNHDTGEPNGLFSSGLFRRAPFQYSHTFNDVGSFDYFCSPHRVMGMIGTVNVGTVTAAAQPLNVSTRLRVQSGQNAMIGGFIVTGDASKRVIIRAIGPSLSTSGVSGVLADTTVQLNGGGGTIGSNDNWKDSQQAEIQASGVPPLDDRESAIIATLTPGNYTAIVEGKNGTSGVGLVEVYDLDQAVDSKLANISTRGVVETGNNVMIGGFVLGKETSAARVIVRAIGPTLAESGISGALADPVLELRDSNGELVRSNNNWKESQQAEIEATGIPPRNDLESAIVATLPPAPYTAIVAGNGGTTGVGLVEVYQLP
ncbi:MAG: hypothetical protein H0W20_01320 [Chthoniobacterales bacterium]|nr:hypothetical protein [Chthoniobacterales bacterium]